MMKYLAILFCFFSVSAFADGFKVDETYVFGELSAEVVMIEDCSLNDMPIAFRPLGDVQTMAMSCKTRSAVKAGLTAGSIALEMIGLGCAASGVGVPVAVTVGGVGVGLHIISFMVENVPCEDKEQVEKLCGLMKANGYKCDPDSVDRIEL